MIKNILMASFLLVALSACEQQCFFFCHDGTEIQARYVNTRDDCQDEADDVVARTAPITISDKERNTRLLEAFALCMKKNNWGVTSPRRTKTKKNGPNDNSNLSGDPWAPSPNAIRQQPAPAPETLPARPAPILRQPVRQHPQQPYRQEPPYQLKQQQPPPQPQSYYAPVSPQQRQAYGTPLPPSAAQAPQNYQRPPANLNRRVAAPAPRNQPPGYGTPLPPSAVQAPQNYAARPPQPQQAQPRPQPPRYVARQAPPRPQPQPLQAQPRPQQAASAPPPPAYRYNDTAPAAGNNQPPQTIAEAYRQAYDGKPAPISGGDDRTQNAPAARTYAARPSQPRQPQRQPQASARYAALAPAANGYVRQQPTYQHQQRSYAPQQQPPRAAAPTRANQAYYAPPAYGQQQPTPTPYQFGVSSQTMAQNQQRAYTVPYYQQRQLSAARGGVAPPYYVRVYDPRTRRYVITINPYYLRPRPTTQTAGQQQPMVNAPNYPAAETALVDIAGRSLDSLYKENSNRAGIGLGPGY